MRLHLTLALTLFATTTLAAAPPTPRPTSGLDSLQQFPLAVWLQSPANAPKFKALGVNLYVGLWQGPTEAQLTALEKAAMPVICDQNPEALKPRWQNQILAWMQNDEPDNAQSLPNNKGYGPPILPAAVQDQYKKIKSADPGRPVLLNLGQGVAWDGWYGRGTRTNKPEDYPLYAKGGDILSFDIYPAASTDAPITNNLFYVGRGTERLAQWTDHKKPVWACIECTHISNAKNKATPAQVKAEVWLAITHGATGLIYFVHQFAPTFVEAALLQDPEMSAAIRDINQQIQQLTPAIYSNEPIDPAQVQTTTPISLITRRLGKTVYVFAVSESNIAGNATFTLPGTTNEIQVLGENRTLQSATGKWTDTFTPYQPHLYLIDSQPTP